MRWIIECSPGGVRFPDEKRVYGIEIRKGSRSFTKISGKNGRRLFAKQVCLNDIMPGVTTTEKAIEPGKTKIDGLKDHVFLILNYFDQGE
jgi:hypothetical protein